MKPRGNQATNTSTLEIDKIAAVTTSPESVHRRALLQPAKVMMLLEVDARAQNCRQAIVNDDGAGRASARSACSRQTPTDFIGNASARSCANAIACLEEGERRGRSIARLQGFGFPWVCT